MPISAFIVRVAAAEALVSPLRRRFDSTFALGVPAHISVLVPFMDPADIGPDVLARARAALSEVAAFDFVLREMGRFPDTTYLAPEPARPFVAITQALVCAFPAYLPYGGAHAEVIPHLSVAHGDPALADAAALELGALLRDAGPVHARCTSVLLIENATGRWREMHAFALQATPGK
ncbi:2'-5' RNA ligase family protein [Variovorax ginsengisoli]|uniref:2'-5' RNA ligase family protein n=1 Tax=Variovorax ginsengisoli TaxID=363844 RepID=A0ABT9S3H1_9BURK|nr:2'-5' RNA ligase family protein [Variovorax ginsengisoli]MDP9898885.1 hypothetical protein [Variovorax ginsengisoli]